MDTELTVYCLNGKPYYMFEKCDQPLQIAILFCHRQQIARDF